MRPLLGRCDEVYQNPDLRWADPQPRAYATSVEGWFPGHGAAMI
jgi:hypothetical protein